MNSKVKDKKQKKKPTKSASENVDIDVIALEFQDNLLASKLFGQFDQHLAMIEQQLDIEAISRGNEITLKGESTSVHQAKMALEHVYQRLETGDEIEAGDIDGAIRMASADNQLSLPDMEKPSLLSMAKIGTRKKVIQARTPTQDAYIRAMDRSELVFGVGPAGTGKTYLAVAYAASLLERGAIDRIILSRPAVEAGERLGFLPGDMKEKVDPYLRPLYDALYDMMPGDKVERELASGIIEIAPLAFMRGRTLSNAAVILDEAQNTTSMQMKMFLTRLGENSRMIVTGDPSQIDLPGGVKSGLIEALDLLGNIKGVSRIRFKAEDVVRHRLVAEIVRAYDAPAKKSSDKNDT